MSLRKAASTPCIGPIDNAVFHSPQAHRRLVSSSDTETASIESIPVEQLKVRFDIITTRVVQEKLHKYVVYMIIVMEVPQLDRDGAVIERRYNDFLNLHQGLKKECPEAVRHLPFPKKVLFTKSLNDSIIKVRSRQFQKYLRYIYHQPRVKDCKSFKEFFYLPHLRSATMSLRYENYPVSYENYKLAMHLQRKLQVDEDELIYTICSLVEVCRSQRKYEEADSLASDALDRLQYDPKQIWLLPLLKATLEVRKKLLVSSTWLRDKVIECENMNTGDQDVTLRELAVKYKC